jgi:hypothetical protein
MMTTGPGHEPGKVTKAEYHAARDDDVKIVIQMVRRSCFKHAQTLAIHKGPKLISVPVVDSIKINDVVANHK